MLSCIMLSCCVHCISAARLQPFWDFRDSTFQVVLCGGFHGASLCSCCYCSTEGLFWENLSVTILLRSNILSYNHICTPPVSAQFEYQGTDLSVLKYRGHVQAHLLFLPWFTLQFNSIQVCSLAVSTEILSIRPNLMQSTSASGTPCPGSDGNAVMC